MSTSDNRVSMVISMKQNYRDYGNFGIFHMFAKCLRNFCDQFHEIFGTRTKINTKPIRTLTGMLSFPYSCPTAVLYLYMYTAQYSSRYTSTETSLVFTVSPSKHNPRVLLL